MSGVGSFLARCRFTYKGLDDTLDRIEMTMEMEYRPPPSGKLTVAASEMSFKSGKLWVEPGAGGTGWFDRHRGRLDHAEIAFHYMGKYTLTINGEDAEVETDAPTRITINIQEFEKPPTKK